MNSNIIKTERIVLDKIEFGFQRQLSEFLTEPYVESYIDHFTQNMVLHVGGYLAGKNLPSDTIIYPCNWWESFKERFFPKFLLNKFPVIYTKYTIDKTIVLPDLKLAFPKEKQQLLYAIWKTEIKEDKDEQENNS